MKNNKQNNIEKNTNTFGQKIADKVASFGGSWPFIIIFLSFIILWITTNVFMIANKNAFDPYPFILLNLILSCVAALQAPIIMMSQNRQEEKDRERAKEDYNINLKAEKEIRELHNRIIDLKDTNSKQFIEIQNLHIELLAILKNK